MIFKTLKDSIYDISIIGSTLTEIGNLRLDPTNVNGYVNALRGLSTQQAQLVLSTKGLSATQQQAILSQLNYANATGTLTTAQMTSALVTETRNEADARALLLNAGLISSEASEATATNTVTAAKLKELVATGRLTQAEAQLLATKAGVTLANQKEASSFALLGDKFKNFGNSLLALGKAHPVLSLVAAGIALLTSAITIAEKKNEEFIKSQEEIIKKIDENISEYDDEISSLDSLQKKLQDAKGNKEALAQIQSELNQTIGDTPGLLNEESNAYDIANQKIDDRIERLKELRKLELEDKVTAQKEIFNNTLVDNAMGIDHKFDYFANHKIVASDTLGSEFSGYLEGINTNRFETLQSIFEALKKNGYGDGEKSNAEIWKELIDSYGGAMLDVEEIQNYFDSQTEYAQKILSDYVNNSESIFSKEELNSIIEDLVESGYSQDLEGIENVITSLVENDELEKTINDYYESLYNDDIDSDTLYQNIKSQFDTLVTNYPELKGILENYFNSIGKDIETGINNVSSNPDGTTDLFTETLNSADYAKIKEELLELAKSGEITPETLSSTEEYNSLLKETETSAESATNQILDMLSAQEKLSGLSQGLDKLKTAYEEFKDEDIGFVTAETLSSLPDAFKNLPEFDLFSQIVGDPTSGVNAIQQSFNDIVKAYMLSQDTLQGLVGASEHDIQSYIANIKQMGITNAEEVINTAVQVLNTENTLVNEAEKEFYEAHLAYLQGKSELDLEYLTSSASNNGKLISALGQTYKSDYDNWCDLLAKKAEAYNNFIDALKESGIIYDSSLTARGNADNYVNQGHSASEISDMYNKAAKADYSSYQSDKQKLELKIDLAPITTNFGTNFAPSTSSSSGGSSSAEKEQEKEQFEELFDFIERRLKKIQRYFDRWVSNAESVIDASETVKGLLWRYYKRASGELNQQMSTYSSAADRYMAEADKSGLSEEYKQKVRDGAIDLETITDETLAEQIKSYQEW